MRLALGLLAAVLGTVAAPASAAKAARACDENLNLVFAEATCYIPPGEAKRRLRQPSGPYKQSRYAPLCAHDRGAGDAGDCNVPVSCAPSAAGDRYRIQERTVTPGQEPTEWVTVAETCFTPEDLGQIGSPTVTPGQVLTEFRRLAWPEADLVIQPVGGETLVNIPTVFHVTNPDPSTQTVTLLGQSVEIEATPTSWTWHWAKESDKRTSSDDTDAHTTTYPGTPYPGTDVAHAYTRTGTVHPSVDVTYSGRYRLSGGPWTDLPDTHTVAGQAQELTVLEARPTLVR